MMTPTDARRAVAFGLVDEDELLIQEHSLAVVLALACARSVSDDAPMTDVDRSETPTVRPVCGPTLACVR